MNEVSLMSICDSIYSLISLIKSGTEEQKRLAADLAKQEKATSSYRKKLIASSTELDRVKSELVEVSKKLADITHKLEEERKRSRQQLEVLRSDLQIQRAKADAAVKKEETMQGKWAILMSQVQTPHDAGAHTHETSASHRRGSKVLTHHSSRYDDAMSVTSQSTRGTTTTTRPGRDRKSSHIVKTVHVLRDTADQQDVRSPFPTGQVFRQLFQAFVTDLSGQLSALITACETFSAYHHLLHALETHMHTMFADAQRIVETFSRPVPLPADIDWSTIAKGEEGYRLAQYQTIQYGQLEEYVSQHLTLEVLDPSLVAFHTELLALYETEAAWTSDSSNVEQPPHRDSRRILNETVHCFVLSTVQQLARYLWIAKFSDPPCGLHPDPATVWQRDDRSMSEVMNRRQGSQVWDEVVLLPALYFWQTTKAKWTVVVRGLSFAKEAIQTRTPTCNNEETVPPMASEMVHQESEESVTGISLHNDDSALRESMMTHDSSHALEPSHSDDVHSHNGSEMSSIHDPDHHDMGHDMEHDMGHDEEREETPTEEPSAPVEEIHYDQEHHLRLVGLPNVGNSCYMNAALQLMAHAPPLVHLLTSSTLKYAMADVHSKDITIYPEMHRLLIEMANDNHAVHAYHTAATIKHRVAALVGGNNHTKRDAADVVRTVLCRIQNEIRDCNRLILEGHSHLPTPLRIAGFGRYPRRPSDNDQGHVAAAAWRKLLASREHGSNPLIDAAFPQRRCRRRCSHCQHETVTFDAANVVHVPVPTASDRRAVARRLASQPSAATTVASSLDAEDAASAAAAAPVPMVAITVIVQLLDRVPAMVYLPMAVSMSMTVGELKEQLLQDLVSLGYVTRSSTLSQTTHFHFSCLEMQPMRQQDAASPSMLRLVRTGNATSFATEAELNVTLQEILSPDESKSVLVASQLAVPASGANVPSGDTHEREFVYYDVSFGEPNRPSPYDHPLGVDQPSHIRLMPHSIPYRLAFACRRHRHGEEKEYPAARELHLAVQNLATRLFDPAALTLGETTAGAGNKPHGSSRTGRSHNGWLFPANAEPSSSSFTVDFTHLHPDGSSAAATAAVSTPKSFPDRVLCSVTKPPPPSMAAAVFRFGGSRGPQTVDPTMSGMAYDPNEKCYVSIQDYLVHARRHVSSETSSSLTSSSSRSSHGNDHSDHHNHHHHHTGAVRGISAHTHAHAHAHVNDPHDDHHSHHSHHRRAHLRHLTDIPSFTLTEAFQTAALPHPLEGAICPECHASDGQTIAYDLWTVGEVLFIQLDRFPANTVDDTTHAWSPCDFPVDGLSLKHITTPLDPARTCGGSGGDGNDDDAVYDLYGVVQHSGGDPNYGHGHFWATCRVNVGSGEPARWMRFNDDYVQATRADSIEQDRVYLLCYMRRPSSSASTSTMSPAAVLGASKGMTAPSSPSPSSVITPRSPSGGRIFNYSAEAMRSTPSRGSALRHNRGL
eukprot:gene8297-5986_t